MVLVQTQDNLVGGAGEGDSGAGNALLDLVGDGLLGGGRHVGRRTTLGGTRLGSGIRHELGGNGWVEVGRQGKCNGLRWRFDGVEEVVVVMKGGGWWK